MTQPFEMSIDLPMQIANGEWSTTTNVWAILQASHHGDIDTVREMIDAQPALAYCQYNYTPPIHFAVREGHDVLVEYLLSIGAYDPTYRIYPFLDSLAVLASDRGYDHILTLLNEYSADPSLQKFKGDTGRIEFRRSDLQRQFEKAVDSQNMQVTESLLKQDPTLVNDSTYFWGEGILLRPAKENNRALLDLLMAYGAKVPPLLKWIQFYYFENYDMAAYLMKSGMDPNTRSWQEVTILHDMAQKGNVAKAKLLLDAGAAIDPIDDEYRSTPLGMAARWGHAPMVEFLLNGAADVNRSGAEWSTPLAWARKNGHSDIESMLMAAGAIN